MVRETHVFPRRQILRKMPQVYSERELYYLHNKFGASARSLVAYASDPECYASHVIEEIWEMNPNTMRQMFSQPHSVDPRYIAIIESLTTRRDTFERRVASRHVFELLWKVYFRHQPTSDMMDFCRLFQANSITTARWAFEIQVHRFLRRQQTIRLIPLVQDKPMDANLGYDRYAGENLVALRLTRSEEYHYAKGDGLYANQYYTPDPADFPAIDSFFLIHRSHLASPSLSYSTFRGV